MKYNVLFCVPYNISQNTWLNYKQTGMEKQTILQQIVETVTNKENIHEQCINNNKYWHK